MFSQRTHVVDQERRMRLLGRVEGILDAEMHLHRAVGKPSPAARGEFRRLRLLAHLQQVAVERSGLLLAAGRDGKLHMVDGLKDGPWMGGRDRRGPTSGVDS